MVEPDASEKASLARKGNDCRGCAGGPIAAGASAAHPRVLQRGNSANQARKPRVEHAVRARAQQWVPVTVITAALVGVVL